MSDTSIEHNLLTASECQAFVVFHINMLKIFSLGNAGIRCCQGPKSRDIEMGLPYAEGSKFFKSEFKKCFVSVGQPVYTHLWMRRVKLLNGKHVDNVNFCQIQLYHGSIVFWWQCKRRQQSAWWFCRLTHLHGCIQEYLGGDFRHGGFQLFRKGSCDFNHVIHDKLCFVLYIFFVFIMTKMIKVIIIAALLLKCVKFSQST